MKSRSEIRRALASDASWAYLAWALYLCGSIGYAVADGLSVLGVRVSYNLYLFLAVLFLLDAIIYFIVWYLGSSKGRRVLGIDAWAELVNIWASVFLVMAAIMDVLPVPPLRTPLQAHSMALITSGVYFCSTATYCLDAFMFNSAWHSWRVEDPGAVVTPWYKDASLWAELFNTIPSLGYCATGILSLFSHMYLEELGSSSIVYAASREIVMLSRRVNFVFDIMYVIDALFYLATMRQQEERERKERLGIHGNQQMVGMIRPGDAGASEL